MASNETANCSGCGSEAGLLAVVMLRRLETLEPGIKVLGLVEGSIDRQTSVGNGAFHLQSTEHQEDIVPGVAAKDGGGRFRTGRSSFIGVAVDEQVLGDRHRA